MRPFIWWIQDLSAPDRLFNFDMRIPVYGCSRMGFRF